LSILPPLADVPNIYDLETEAEHAATGERLKRRRDDAEALLALPAFKKAAAVIELAEAEREIKLWTASRRRRADFQRRGIIPPD